MAEPAVGSRCALHTDSPAVDVCARCGAFVCLGCARPVAKGVQCPACAALLDRPPTLRVRLVFWVTSAWATAFVGAVVALSTDFAGMFSTIFILLTPVEVGVMAALWVQEWHARRRGEAGPSGRLYLWGSVAALLLLTLFSVLFALGIAFTLQARRH